MPNDLHVSLLTPPGRGAVNVLRVTGGGAVDVVDALFHAAAGRPLAESPRERIVFGRWGKGGEEVVVCRRSECSIEIHCHGGSAASTEIMRSLESRGAAKRDWCEAEQQRLDDPIAVEALQTLSRATTRRTAAILLDQFHGALRRELQRIAEVLAQGRVDAAVAGIDALLKHARFGLHLTQPWRVVLAGPPNVGKSSLINALVGYERAVVFDQPGTTRDIVRAAAAFDGWPVELSDTAGLRIGGDELEAAGVRLAEQQLAAADLVVLVFDANAPWTPAQDNLVARLPSALLAHNKCDLSSPSPQRPTGLSTSAKTGQGTKDLITGIVARLVPHVPLAIAGIPFTPRQIDLLQEARRAINQADSPTACTVSEYLLTESSHLRDSLPPPPSERTR